MLVWPHTRERRETQGLLQAKPYVACHLPVGASEVSEKLSLTGVPRTEGNSEFSCRRFS